MTTTQVKIQVPANQALRLVPRRITVDEATLEIPSSDDSRLLGRWSRGTTGGEASIEVKRLSKRSSELVVTLEAPSMLEAWKVRSSRLGAKLSGALRYEIETRAVEQTDPFASRRTTSARVKERIA